MDIIQTMRQIVFLAMYTSLVVPGYLVMRFHTPEWLFLYVPVLAFWTVLIYTHVENSQQVKSEPTLEVHP